MKTIHRVENTTREYMKNPIKYIFPALLSVITLSGCRNVDDPEFTHRQDFPAFKATIGSLQTRAYDEVWEENDEIGVSGCNRSNICYLTGNGDGSFTVKNNGEQIYFQDDNEAIFTAYHPWNELEAGAAINTETKDQSRQKSFDFLWATASGQKDSPEVSFQFAHVMTKVSLTVKPGIDMKYEELKNIVFSLKGFHHTGSFNTEDGTTSTGEDMEEWIFTEFAHYNDEDETITFSLILFPQELDNPLDISAKLLLEDNNTLSLGAKIDFTNANRKIDSDNARNEWVAGRQYNLSLTLNKTEFELNGCSIINWNVVTGDDIIVD